jgi:hypothetical protein
MMSELVAEIREMVMLSEAKHPCICLAEIKGNAEMLRCAQHDIPVGLRSDS